ncbi:hypothetical protein TNCT_104671 [Trichonephila clavata]|uniref:Uncharacterized protein n=1 Tax=Trichonephila clavata TaxID=2740835 RepID=A0A8X6JNE0_TRICU|nr:hypothetical protein TNCT_104671 [Trichonephila clavata]
MIRYLKEQNADEKTESSHVQKHASKLKRILAEIELAIQKNISPFLLVNPRCLPPLFQQILQLALNAFADLPLLMEAEEDSASERDLGHDNEYRERKPENYLTFPLSIHAKCFRM